jgi:hypothetical protein
LMRFCLWCFLGFAFICLFVKWVSVVQYIFSLVLHFKIWRFPHAFFVYALSNLFHIVYLMLLFLSKVSTLCLFILSPTAFLRSKLELDWNSVLVCILFFFFNWLYNPWWVLASLTTVLQASLSASFVLSVFFLASAFLAFALRGPATLVVFVS